MGIFSKKFGCTSCGLCCTHLGAILKSGNPRPEIQEAIDEFPHGSKGDGSCEKLVDGLCEVYEDRPLLCNIKKMYDTYPTLAAKRKDWYDENKRGCNQLIVSEGLDDKFIVK